MGRNIGKDISKNLSSKYSQKLFDHAKQTATARVSKLSPQNNSETNEEKYISPELRQKIIDALRLKKKNFIDNIIVIN